MKNENNPIIGVFTDISRVFFFLAAACLLFPALVISCATTGSAAPAAEDTGTSVVTEPVQEEPVEETPALSHVEEESGFDKYAFASTLADLLEAGDFDAAVSFFDTVPEPDASSLDILKLKLSILISAGDLKAASSLADSLEAEYKNDTEILYSQAVIALAENKTLERGRYLKKIVEIDPDNTEALVTLAEDSLGKKAYGDAKNWYQKAVNADPENISAVKGLAHSYFMQDKLDEAMSVIDKAIADNPDSSELWAERALIHSEKRNNPRALDDIRRAIELNPEVSSYWTNYGIFLLKASKLGDALDAFTEAIKLNPDDYLPYIYRCGVNDSLGNTEAAVSDYRFVCERYPQYYYAAEGLGALLWLQGDYAGAKDAFAHANKYAPKDSSYALMYTLCCYHLGQKEEARKFIAKFMNTLDRSSTEYFVCRLFYDRTGDADVVNRISREKDASLRAKYMFYMASYYELFQNKSLAMKIYSEITETQGPSFFEHRLAAAKVKNAPAEISSLMDGN